MTAITANTAYVKITADQLKQECKKHIPGQVWNVIETYIKQNPDKVFFKNTDNDLIQEDLNPLLTKSGIYVVKDHADSQMGVIIVKVTSHLTRILYQFTQGWALDHYNILHKWEEVNPKWDKPTREILMYYRANSSAINMLFDLNEDEKNFAKKQEKSVDLCELQDTAKAQLSKLHS